MASPRDPKAEKRINILFSKETHMQAKAIAALMDITLAEYIQKAIESSITEDSPVIERSLR